MLGFIELAGPIIKLRDDPLDIRKKNDIDVEVPEQGANFSWKVKNNDNDDNFNRYGTIASFWITAVSSTCSKAGIIVKDQSFKLA